MNAPSKGKRGQSLRTPVKLAVWGTNRRPSLIDTRATYSVTSRLLTEQELEFLEALKANSVEDIRTCCGR